MGFSKYVRRSSHFNPKFATQKEACTEISPDAFKSEYIGCGISPSKHPLNGTIYMEGRSCLNCGSEKVKVIYAQRTIHPMNGNEYFDLELVCEDCMQFSLYAYADND